MIAVTRGHHWIHLSKSRMMSQHDLMQWGMKKISYWQDFVLCLFFVAKKGKNPRPQKHAFVNIYQILLLTIITLKPPLSLPQGPQAHLLTKYQGKERSEAEQ